MRGGLAGEQVKRMSQRRPEHLEAVAGAARRAREVDDEGRPDDTGEPAGQQPVWRLGAGIGPERLCDPGCWAVENLGGRLRSDVARPETRPPRRQHDARNRCQLADGGGDRCALVGDDPALDLVALLAQEIREDLAATVLALAGRDAVGDRQDSCSQSRASFVFSRSLTSSTTISLSIALAMS
jgi:hypothetical protein